MEPFENVLFCILCGQQENVDISRPVLLANGATNGEAVESGHVQVQNDDGGKVPLERGQRLRTIGCDAYLKSCRGDQPLQSSQHQVVVVDQQYARRVGEIELEYLGCGAEVLVHYLPARLEGNHAGACLTNDRRSEGDPDRAAFCARLPRIANAYVRETIAERCRSGAAAVGEH